MYQCNCKIRDNFVQFLAIFLETCIYNKLYCTLRRTFEDIHIRLCNKLNYIANRANLEKDSRKDTIKDKTQEQQELRTYKDKDIKKRIRQRQEK